MDEQERELNGEPGEVLGGEASTAFGGGPGLGRVGTDASSEDLPPVEPSDGVSLDDIDITQSEGPDVETGDDLQTQLGTPDAPASSADGPAGSSGGAASAGGTASSGGDDG